MIATRAALAALNLLVNLHCPSCDCVGFSRAKLDALRSLTLDEAPTVLVLRDSRCRSACDSHALVHVRADGVTYYLDSGTVSRDLLTSLPPWWTVVRVEETKAQ